MYRLRSYSRDRISDLPTSTIQHILGFLPTKEAVRTCVLSKRWRSLWTEVPNLLFPFDSSQDVNRFVSFVDNTLMLYSSPKVEKFLLDLIYGDELKNRVDSWLHFVANHEVENLCLNIRTERYKFHAVIRSLCFNYRTGKYKFPEFLCSNSFLKEMKLKSIDFDGRVEGFRWTSLKVLTLKYICVETAVMRAILLGSPLLEYVCLHTCLCDGIIDAANTNLKELVMTCCVDAKNSKITVLGPNVLSLTVLLLFGYMPNLVNFSSLVEANINFSRKVSGDLISFVEKLSHVNKLTVGLGFSQKLSIMQVKGARFATSTRKILVISIEFNKWYLPGLLALLYSSPELERLIIKANSEPVECFNFISAEDFEHHLRPLREPFVIQNLKCVEITGFVVGLRSDGDEILVKVVQYLLANAKVLQKLIIYVDVDPMSNISNRSSFLVARKLSCCPRASPDAVVEFKTRR